MFNYPVKNQFNAVIPQGNYTKESLTQEDRSRFPFITHLKIKGNDKRGYRYHLQIGKIYLTYSNRTVEKLRSYLNVTIRQHLKLHPENSLMC